jgi:chorismate mutase
MWKYKLQRKLEESRRIIDQIDPRILEMLGKRMQASEKIGDIKAELGLPVCVPKRENEVIRKRRLLGRIYFLDDEFVCDLFELILRESKKIQNRNLVG